MKRIGLLGFDTAQAFAPIILLANSPNVLVAHPNVPAKSFRELIAYAKAHPDKLNYASPGKGHFNVLRGFIKPLHVAGIKVVSDFVDNYKVGLPSEMVMLNLFDPDTGKPTAALWHDERRRAVPHGHHGQDGG